MIADNVNVTLMQFVLQCGPLLYSQNIDHPISLFPVQSQ